MTKKFNFQGDTQRLQNYGKIGKGENVTGKETGIHSNKRAGKVAGPSYYLIRSN